LSQLSRRELLPIAILSNSKTEVFEAPVYNLKERMARWPLLSPSPLLIPSLLSCKQHAPSPAKAEGHSGKRNGSIRHPFDSLVHKTAGVVRGLFFGSLRPRPARVSFVSLVPHGEGFDNPRYVKFEPRFSKRVKQNDIHECTVTVGRDTFLISAYWEGKDSPNTAVEVACPGLEWRGEITVVQAGRFVTFYKDVKNLSVASKAVSK
jgi:hypothetical protein